ncbi:MAG: DUF4302 domain-containing protein [Bacteroidetes bacterium]|nr:DUF4302 domain-containing protein [Bacteroidota bacterium]
MKRAYLFCIIASVAFASCKKDKTVFSETADERINAVLSSYQQTLAGAPYGWKGFIFPGALSGGVVSFYFKFSNTNRVQMFSDFDSLSNVTMLESSYRLKALQQPALIFDTYSYVSVLADPDASVNNGSYGSGLNSDFEFAIDSVKGDTIRLTGRLHSTKAYLVKATQQEMNDYYNKLHTNRLFDNIVKYITYFKRIVVNGVTYEILGYPDNRIAVITWVDGSGNAHTVKTGYYYTTTGVGFVIPVVNGTTVISSLDNISWNAASAAMTLSVGGNSQVVAQAAKPLAADLTGGLRWWQSAAGSGNEWKTVYGFHSNGVDDAFGIRTIANFYYMGYLPNFGTSGGTPYDITGFYKVINNQLTLNYAPAYLNPSFFTDGRARFTYIGYLGTIPTADSIPVAKTRIQLSNGNGYYFIQVDDQTYDMVYSVDAKTWLRWQY